MRRDRLLLVIDGMEVGGSQRQIQHLLAGLDRRRWAPELVYFRCDSFLVEAIKRSGIQVHYVPKRHAFDLRFLISFTRLLHRGNYAIVHAYSLTAELWSAVALALSRRGSMLIASERSSFRRDVPAWYWPLKRFVLARSTAVVANSRAGAQSTARRTGTPDALFAVVANGVDLPKPVAPDERKATRNAICAPEGRAVGLFVGRLVTVKNVPCLIRALALLPSQQRPWIALAGDGPLRASIEQLAVVCGVTADLCLLGERSDATRLMQAADFLVLPSHNEGMSNVVLEAMAAGCPVIASAVGGTPELIDDGRTGLLFRSGDASELADAMARVTADPGLRAQLADAAMQQVENHHSQSALVAGMSEIYERSLGHRMRQRHAPYASPKAWKDAG